MRYRLRTLLILLGVLPPLMAGAWFVARSSWDPDVVTVLLILTLIMAVISAGLFVAMAALVGVADVTRRLLQSRYRAVTAIALVVLTAYVIAALFVIWSNFQIPSR